jgi:hypothetical protein
VFLFNTWYVAALRRELTTQPVRRMLAVDLPFQPNTPAEALARIRTESDEWKRIAEQIELQVD